MTWSDLFFFLQDAFADNDITQTGTYFMSPGEMYDSEQDEVETCKPVFFFFLLVFIFTASLWSYLMILQHCFSFQQKKSSKLKGLKKQKAKVNQCGLTYLLSNTESGVLLLLLSDL